MNLQTDDVKGPRVSSGALAANVLRVLGAAATAVGAVIFMLQGFEHIELSWRPWFYLAFITLLGAGGATSLYLFRDARGARMFLALATALVPVQFTQLGGMLHALLNETVSPVPGIFQAGAVSTTQTLLVAGVSAVVLAAASRAGFAILIRQYAKSLWLVFLGLCMLLVVPERASLLGMALLVVMAGVFLWLETKRFHASPVFATWEGWAVRIMFMLPLCIGAVRGAFYLDELTMYAMLLAIVGGLVLAMIRHDFRPWIAESMRAFAATMLMVAWMLLAFEIFAFRYDFFWFAMIFPMGVLLFTVGHFATHGGSLYRWLGVSLVVLSSYALLDVNDGMFSWLTIAATGAGLCLAGAHYRERIPVVIGALQIAVALIAIIALSMRAIAVDTWLVLAVIGITLVLLSSVAERYGIPLSRVRRLMRGRSDG